MTTKLAAMDLFAGCGGLSLGLQSAGIEVKWANERDLSAAATYAAWDPLVKMSVEDVADYYIRMRDSDKNLPGPGQVDLLAGGPPCQGFSGYNRHRNPKDKRNSLVEVFLDFVVYLKPRFVLMENVPGILSLEKGKVIKLLLASLETIGYQARLGILQAGHYGLPQNRWRVFVFAAAKGQQLPDYPPPTHGFPRSTLFGASAFRQNIVRLNSEGSDLFCSPLPTVTVGDAISDLPVIENGGGSTEAKYTKKSKSDFQRVMRDNSTILTDHRCKDLGELMLTRCKAVPKRPGAGWLDLPHDLKPKNLLRHGDDRYDNRFGRLHWDGIFNTILTKPEPYWSRLFHPEQDRVVSVRECARAQGIPDTVRFCGGMTSAYMQVGNAVPPPLAKAIGLEFINAL
jgi:DNA (cytosine-5)-methyltransferase 1